MHRRYRKVTKQSNTRLWALSYDMNRQSSASKATATCTHTHTHTHLPIHSRDQCLSSWHWSSSPSLPQTHPIPDKTVIPYHTLTITYNTYNIFVHSVTRISVCRISCTFYYSVHIPSVGACCVRVVASSSVWSNALSGMPAFEHILIRMIVSLFLNTIHTT